MLFFGDSRSLRGEILSPADTSRDSQSSHPHPEGSWKPLSQWKMGWRESVFVRQRLRADLMFGLGGMNSYSYKYDDKIHIFLAVKCVFSVIHLVLMLIQYTPQQCCLTLCSRCNLCYCSIIYILLYCLFMQCNWQSLRIICSPPPKPVHLFQMFLHFPFILFIPFFFFS